MRQYPPSRPRAAVDPGTHALVIIVLVLAIATVAIPLFRGFAGG